MKIGLSLSFCVRDIMDGKVDISEVVCLITGTCARTLDDWNDVMFVYGEYYWQSNPAKAHSIVNKLRESGRIVQPRLNAQMPPTSIGSRIWVDADSILHSVED